MLLIFRLSTHGESKRRVALHTKAASGFSLPRGYRKRLVQLRNSWNFGGVEGTVWIDGDDVRIIGDND
jgi:hypothetical protein